MITYFESIIESPLSQKREKVEQANHIATALIWLLLVTCMSKWHLWQGMITKIYKLQKDVSYVNLSLIISLMESTKTHRIQV